MRFVVGRHAAPVEQWWCESGDGIATFFPLCLQRKAKRLREGVLNGTRRGQLGFARREFNQWVVQCVDGTFL